MYEYQILDPGATYHLCNRGNNNESLFIENRNHNYFLSLWQRHTQWVLDTYAYSLNNNYFHLVIQAKDEEWLEKVIENFKSKLDPGHFISRQISNCFNAYAKSFNKVYTRTGSLFEERFKRKLITDDHYFKEVVSYIHLQETSGCNATMETYTSLGTLLSDKPTFLKRDLLFEKFGGKKEFIEYHDRHRDFKIGLHNFLTYAGIPA